VAISISFINL